MPKFETLVDEARQRLAAARHLIAEEISAYPTPIAGCDAQFNHLLAERQRVTDALAALSRQVFVATPRALEPGIGVERR